MRALPHKVVMLALGLSVVAGTQTFLTADFTDYTDTEFMELLPFFIRAIPVIRG